MHEILDRSRKSVIGIRISGTLTSDDIQSLRPYLEQKVQEHGQVRLLILMDDWHGWDSLVSLWEDLKMDLSLNRHVSRIAMVGDRIWEKAVSGITGLFAHGDVQYFDRRRLEHAWSWIDGAAEPAS